MLQATKKTVKKPRGGHEGHEVGEAMARVLQDDKKPWYKKKHLLKLNVYVAGLCLLAAANGYDGSMMNGLLALPQWSKFMEYPEGSWLGFINAVQSLSTAVVYPLVAYFGNKWGRKKGILLGYVFLIAGTLLQTLTPNSTGFIIARVLIGQPSAWWAGLAPLLITEISYPTHRAFVTALYNCGWYIGSTFAAWATFGTRNYDNSWSWRIPSLLQVAIPLIALPIAIVIPESPRYLIATKQAEKARRILTEYHGGGDESSPLVDFEMAEMRIAIEADAAANSSTTWMALISTKGNRHRAFISVTLGIFSQWNGVNVISYYLALILESVGITSVTHQTLISGCLQVWNLIFAVVAAALIDKVGRRPIFLTSSIGMCISFAIICGLSAGFDMTAKASIGIAVVPFLYIFYAFFDIAFTPLIIAYPAEIWPYELRARGMALTLMSTYAAIFFNVFVNPIALKAIAWRYYIVYVAILIVIIITIWLTYPETKGHTLEEMAVVFEGEHANVIEDAANAETKGQATVHAENGKPE